MEAKDLMIGDLVTFKDCQGDEYPTIVKIWQINANGDALASIDGDAVLDEISIDAEVAGIPLTPEILEQNGWSLWEIEGEYKCSDAPTLYGRKAHFGVFDNVYINFVHELQHCLKLVGIEKEIIL